MDNMISVIIPSYNRTHTLKDAILSVCNQNHKNYEIIVVNDCGVDTKFIVDETRKNYEVNIRYIRHEKNKGLAATRNTGIKEAKGEYIAFLDDDDIYYPNHFETLLHGLKNNPEYKIAYSWAKVFVEKNNKKIEQTPYNYFFSKDHFLIENYIPINAFLIKKEIFIQEGFWFNENLRHLEDYDLWLRLIDKYEFLCIPEYTCEVRRVDKSLSQQHIDMYKNQILLYDKNPVDKNNKPKLYCKRKKAYDEFENSIYLIEKLNKKEKLKKVSIIVPCRNNITFLKKLFESIANKTLYYEKELILVNSSTTKEFAEDLKNLLNESKLFLLKCDFDFLFFKENLPLGSLLNAGVNKANGDFLAFIISAIPGFSWLTSMVRFYEQYKDCGIIGGKTCSNQSFSFPKKFKNIIKVFHIDEIHKLEYNNIEKLKMLYSHILFIYRKDFIKIDGFNENLDEFLTILDFTSKINEIGKFSYYNPLAECYF